MRLLLTSDLHLTSVVEDEYRWEFLEWLLSEIVPSVDMVFVLGDLTDAKDKHPAALVARVTDYVVRFAKQCPLFILKGNHDYIDPSTPFFGFLDHVHRRATFVVKPHYVDLGSRRNGIWLLPHTRDKANDWCAEYFQSRYTFIHECVVGARASNGVRMQAGVEPQYFKNARARIFSGDIHVPQRVGKVTYVGAPYPIRFGDTYAPRVILLDTKAKTMRSVAIPNSVRKCSLHIRSVKDLSSADLRAGDHVKVKYIGRKGQTVDWATVSEQVASVVEHAGAHLRALTYETRQRVRLLQHKRTESLSGDDFSALERHIQTAGADEITAEEGRKLMESRTDAPVED